MNQEPKPMMASEAFWMATQYYRSTQEYAELRERIREAASRGEFDLIAKVDEKAYLTLKVDGFSVWAIPDGQLWIAWANPKS